MDQNKEKWSEICFLLSESIKSDISEKDFESQVVRAMEKLGWYEYKGEIQRQTSIQIGRKKYIIPDIVLYDSNKAQLVVEVKRPSEDLTKDETTGQLTSYMRQMKADFGLLIGRQIRMYYDGFRNPQQNPLLLDRISFDKTSNKGVRFVEIFRKNSFTNNGYDLYLEEMIDQFKAKSSLKKLKDIIITNDTKTKILEFLQQEFEDYGSEIVSKALENLNVNLGYEKTVSPNKLEEQKITTTKKMNLEMKNKREQVFEIINAHPNGISFAQIAEQLDLPKKSLRNCIHRLKKPGKIIAVRRGVYKSNNGYSNAKKQKHRITKEPQAKSYGSRERVFEIIKFHPQGISVAELSEKINITKKAVTVCLYRLKKTGRIEAIERGVYRVKL